MTRIVVGFACLFLPAALASGQTRKEAGPARKAAAEPARGGNEEAAVRAVVDAFTRAFNTADTAAMTALFTPNAQVELEDGTTVQGRDAVIELFAANFADDPRPTIAVKTDSITFLAGDVALEEGESTLKYGEEDDAPEVGRYTVLYVKKDGKWLQARIRELPAEAPAPTNHDRLTELEWMLGEWVNESGDGVVETRCEWAAGGAYLLRAYTIKIEGLLALTGTQRIGWDPIQRQFRSWEFDSDGGFSEGRWSRDGDRWIIHATGVTSDGQAVSRTQIVTHVNDHASTWTSIHRSLDGEAIPDIDEFRLVRRPPQPGKAENTTDKKGGGR